MRWTDLVPSMHQLSIPRWYFGEALPEDFKNLQLHVFTDASELSYGCAAYLRMETTSGVRCSLVMARSRVAPLKHQSIPRLELEAALLGARMMRMICLQLLAEVWISFEERFSLHDCVLCICTLR